MFTDRRFVFFPLPRGNVAVFLAGFAAHVPAITEESAENKAAGAFSNRREKSWQRPRYNVARGGTPSRARAITGKGARGQAPGLRLFNDEFPGRKRSRAPPPRKDDGAQRAKKCRDGLAATDLKIVR